MRKKEEEERKGDINDERGKQRRNGGFPRGTNPSAESLTPWWSTLPPLFPPFAPPISDPSISLQRKRVNGVEGEGMRRSKTSGELGVGVASTLVANGADGRSVCCWRPIRGELHLNCAQGAQSRLKGI